MRLLPYIDVTNATNTYTSGQLATQMSGSCGALYFINMSNLCYEIVINLTKGSQMKAHIPSWWARPVIVQSHADSFIVSAAFNPNGMSNPPFSHIAVEIFENEPWDHLIDQAIPAQIASSGSSTVTTAQQLQNDGNAANTSFIESTVSGAPGSSWFSTVDGQVTIAVFKGGALHQALKITATGNLVQISNAGDITEILGNITADGTLSVSGNTTLTGDTFLVNKKLSTASSGDLSDWSGAGLSLKGNPSNNGKFFYKGDGTDTDWNIASIGLGFTGSGNGTFNHNCKQFGAGVAPADFMQNPATGGGSNALGFGSITTTQVTVSALNGNAWRVKAFLG